MNPIHPVYVISKGRWKETDAKTARALERINVPFRIVVEPQEVENYAKIIDRDKILVLPFSNLGQGSIPARNWVWDHSVKSGAKAHWILDDNIDRFYRLNYNVKIPVADGTIFRVAEMFSERYENVGQSGFQYSMFVPRRQKMPPYYLNSRVYSCILNRNDLDTQYRWRGRYNEDTDLSLRILKDGWCTILFNAFLAMKIATMTMKGGNTEELYRQEDGFDGRLEMAKSLQKQHPDVTRVVKKWGRWQHHVDYSGFRQQLKRKPGIKIQSGTDEFGMVLEEFSDKKWTEASITEPVR